MPLKPYIKRVLDAQSLDEKAAATAMGHVMRGEATPAQIAAWLIALRQKGETVGEIVGFTRAMRQEMVVVENVPTNAVDTCGTGGDDLGTFNISTASSLIVAACGVPVAKHGNRAVSSQSGSADVLAALEFAIDPGPEVVRDALGDTGYAFLFAPRFHPAMKHAAGPRREIGVRTIFNLLGPLCNPARVKRQVVGVYDRSRARQIAEVLGAIGAEHVMVVSGPHGADELLPCGDNFVIEWKDGQIREHTMSATEFGCEEVPLDLIRGGTADMNAGIIREIARNHSGPCTEVAAINAGAALVVAGVAETIRDGAIHARQAIQDGRLALLIERAARASHGA